ncbi:rhamnan synthesis F family protein [Sphingobium sp. Ant17]|uniref:rhamnan synthesis F family protein n=1 Tax=Sphingobium sp. Ant17 TaxID=1461752 RepID=UPI0004524132|nr:hypothetical protein BF95_02850 [Sphingobium sp. Ant17]
MVESVWLKKIYLIIIFDFPAGSMFWARTDAILPILSADLEWEDFPLEEGQTDGTLAHCIERMFGVVAVSRNF